MSCRLDEIKRQFSKVLKDLDLALSSSSPSRPPRLVAVSKNYPVEDILHAYSLGQKDFGENRVLELKDKALAIDSQGLDQVVWHFLGKIQSNKCKALLSIPSLGFIHSVDSLKTLQGLYKHESLILQKKIGLFLQVNTSQEGEKQGFAGKEELLEALEWMLSKRSLKEGRLFSPQGVFSLAGLMTMGNIRGRDFAQDARECFALLRELRDSLQEKYSLVDLKLSMGMSDDYTYALEFGTDYLRIGSALFKSN